MRRLVAALAAALAVAAGAGCAGDDDGPEADGTTTGAPAPAVSVPQSGPRPEPPPNRSRWSEAVDAACKPWQDRIDAVEPPLNATGLERWLADLVPLVRSQAGAVAAVKPPAKESEAERARQFVAAFRQLERGLTRYLAAIRAGESAAIQRALGESNAAGVALRGYALALGVTQCGGYSEG